MDGWLGALCLAGFALYPNDPILPFIALTTWSCKG